MIVGRLAFTVLSKRRPSNIFVKLIAGALAAVVSGCVGEPFSYSADRCNGAYNQCVNTCKDAPFGGAQSACFDRCLANESQCYSIGPNGDGSTLAEESLISVARSQAEKEADFQRWKARRDRERAAAEAAAGEIEVSDEPDDNQ